jgi:hypothetical protein
VIEFHTSPAVEAEVPSLGRIALAFDEAPQPVPVAQRVGVVNGLQLMGVAEEDGVFALDVVLAVIVVQVGDDMYLSQGQAEEGWRMRLQKLKMQPQRSESSKSYDGHRTL